MAERTIQTSRKVQKKARKDGIDPNLAILELCNTPRDSELYSDVFVDAQEHFCQLVTSSWSLKWLKNVAENLKKERKWQKKYYGQHATSIPTLNEEDHVMAKRDPKSTCKLTKIKEEIPPPIVHVNCVIRVIDYICMCLSISLLNKHNIT
jgi:hypothetical protein